MGYKIPTAYFVVIFILCIVLGLFILVLMGNTAALCLLSKCGIPVYSKKLKKDFYMLKKVSKYGIGWIDIPGVCYAPIMKRDNEFYKNHNYIDKFSVYGELFVSQDNKAEKLLNFSLNKDEVLCDLSIIKGSPKGKYEDLRHSNFSILRKIEKWMKEDSDYIVSLIDNNGFHHFKPIGVIEIQVGEKHILSYKSREDFIDSLLNISSLRNNFVEDNKILILECNTGIDSVLVLLSEI